MDTFTPRQKRLLEKCLKDGFGTFLFAASVEKQGWCSQKQEETLDRLHSAAEYRRNNCRKRPRWGSRQQMYDCCSVEYGEGGEM